MIVTPSRRLRSLAASALGACLAFGLPMGASPAQAAYPPQPGHVPHMNFGETQQLGNVRVTIDHGTKFGEASIWEHKVKVCNRGSEAQPVGPDTFSNTTNNYDTRFYEPHAGYLAPGLKHQWVEPGDCASGSLVSVGREPYQLAFHDLRTQQRYDILPATEWDGILKVNHPRSAGTSGYHGDFTNDKVADVVALSKGQIVSYRTVNGPSLRAIGGTGARGLNSAYNWIGKASDMDHNGATDILARDASGTMWQQRMLGNSRAGFATIIGYDFNNAKDMTVLNDVNGDGHPELLAIRTDNTLTRQAVRQGRMSSPVKIGKNWGAIREILSVGDFSGDGRADLLAIAKDGNLYRYTLNAKGAITSTTKVGHGWSGFTQVFSPGDLNRDGRRDMVGVRSDGHLYFYANKGAGRWGTAKKIGTNWRGVNSIA